MSKRTKQKKHPASTEKKDTKKFQLLDSRGIRKATSRVLDGAPVVPIRRTVWP